MLFFDKIYIMSFQQPIEKYKDLLENAMSYYSKDEDYIKYLNIALILLIVCQQTKL